MDRYEKRVVSKDLTPELNAAFEEFDRVLAEHKGLTSQFEKILQELKTQTSSPSKTGKQLSNFLGELLDNSTEEAEKIERELKRKVKSLDNTSLGVKSAIQAIQDFEIFKQIQKFETPDEFVDVCLLVDATHSMKEYLEIMKKEIKSIFDEIVKRYGLRRSRFAVVAYRDVDDGDKRVFKLDFGDFEIARDVLS